MGTKDIELRTPSLVEMIEVIHTQAARGAGTKENPVRIVEQYWSKDGRLLAEYDSIGEEYQNG